MKFIPTRLIVLCLFAGMPAVANQVILNEIMYHPVPAVPEDHRLEWLELHNKDTNAVNLRGWRFSKGISFAFTNDTLVPPGGYLVVAANVATFRSRYPGVTNVVGDWNGVLSNNGDQIQLDDANGDQEDSVEYASEGDWAVRQRGPDDLGHQGWIWFTEADGLGNSLELINPALPSQHGQNWASSISPNGTPGARNSVLRSDIAPLILDVLHFPAVPRSTDTVAVTARILDELTNGLTVSVFYRVDVNPQFNAFSQLAMFDDGAHGDGAAGDGVYGAILPARPDGTIVECYVLATDAAANSRTWPGPTLPTGTQTANLLYQVDDSDYGGDQPLYRLIMTQAEAAELASIPCSNAQESDATMNGTFITRDGVKTEVRYTCGFRNRGHGSRCPGDRVPNYRVNIPNDRRWNGVPHLNLNTQFPHAQVVGSALFQKSGLPMADSRPVQVRVNNVNLANAGLREYGSYAHDEELGAEFLARHFPLDTAGNVYRGIRVDPNVAYANFNYYGPDKSSCIVAPACYTSLYFKQNNNSEDDWSDIIGICFALSTNTLDAQYSAAVHRVLDVTNWMLYFAVNTLVDNRETALSNGEGDDYAMYRSGVDGRFRLMGYDTDTIIGQGDSPGSVTAGLFRMTNTPPSGLDRTNTAIIRFITWPEFTPIYYGTLKRLIETTFSADQFNPMLDRLLGDWVPNVTIEAMKNWQAQRNAFVLSQLPTNLVVTSPTNLVNGYLQASGPTVSLAGLAHIIDTRSVLVNGSLASWNHLRGTWSIDGVSLQPGINRVLIQALNAAGQEFQRLNVDLWYDDGSLANVAGALSTDTVWSPAAGPYNVTATLTVPGGTTLTIQPGTTIYLAAGAGVTVNGRLLAEGTETQHIRFTRLPGSAGNWGSLDFLNSSVESRLAYVDFDFCGGTTIGGHNAQLHVNNAMVFIDHCTWP
ncbi:MAG TPA: CotH kinase family protein, partial [Candidatus Binatia bacterium]|nr:CotH kinase family protein [Candidatus Binatia bacterium]